MSRYRKIKRLSLAEQDALAVKAKTGDIAARNALIESVIPAVASQIWRVSKPGEDTEDYTQEAALHLLESVSRYDPARGHFLAFALPWASGARHAWWHKQGWQRAYQGVSFVSMSTPLLLDGGNQKMVVADRIAAEEDTTVEQESTRRAIRAGIKRAGLTDRERLVLDIAVRLDLENGFQTQCAKEMSLSRERIGQIWTGRNHSGKGIVGKLRVALAEFSAEAA